MSGGQNMGKRTPSLDNLSKKIFCLWFHGNMSKRHEKNLSWGHITGKQTSADKFIKGLHWSYVTFEALPTVRLD